jgi:DNA-binding helix-hairpin-helix protein with protein kinase domain
MGGTTTERLIDVLLTDLTLAEKLADGGQGTVFRLTDGRLLKLYHPEVAVLAAELGRLIQLPVRDLVGGTTAWPTGRVFHRGRCVGLLMPEAPARFATRLAGRSRLLELQYLLYPRRAMWASLALPDAVGRRRLAAGYARLFDVLHRNEVVVGDVSMRNLLWTLSGGPGVYAIDCDGFRLVGRPPAVRPADTAGWVDPASPRAVTLDTDRYKLALLTVRLLLGNHTVTPADVSGRAHSGLDPAVAALAARAGRPGDRPPAAAWLAALTGDVAAGGSHIAFPRRSRSGYPKPPGFPLPDSGGTGKALPAVSAAGQDGNRR